MQKTAQYVGRILLKLAEEKLLYVKKEGRKRIYAPSIDVILAYTEIE